MNNIFELILNGDQDSWKKFVKQAKELDVPGGTYHVTKSKDRYREKITIRKHTGIFGSIEFHEALFSAESNDLTDYDHAEVIYEFDHHGGARVYHEFYFEDGRTITVPLSNLGRDQLHVLIHENIVPGEDDRYVVKAKFLKDNITALAKKAIKNSGSGLPNVSHGSSTSICFVEELEEFLNATCLTKSIGELKPIFDEAYVFYASILENPHLTHFNFTFSQGFDDGGLVTTFALYYVRKDGTYIEKELPDSSLTEIYRLLLELLG